MVARIYRGMEAAIDQARIDLLITKLKPGLKFCSIVSISLSKTINADIPNDVNESMVRCTTSYVSMWVKMTKLFTDSLVNGVRFFKP